MDERGGSWVSMEAPAAAEVVRSRADESGPLSWVCLLPSPSALLKAGAGLTLFLASCAGAPVKPLDVAEQERLLVTLRAQNAAYVRQIEELQNRIFLLEDRFDSRRVAAGDKACAPPSPPAVVTLSSHARAEDASADRTAKEPSLPGPAVGRGVGSGPTEPSAGEPGGARVAEAPKGLTASQVRKLLAAQQAEERRQEKLRWKEDVAHPGRAGDVAPLDLVAATAEESSEPPSKPGPSPTSSVDEEDPSAGPAPGGPYISLETPVEYVGEAARTSTRPVLRLHGSGNVAATRKVTRGGGTSGAAAEKPGSRAPATPLVSRRTPLRPRAKAGALDLYESALAALRAHDHDRALAGFRRFVALHPRHDYADNAQYWMGECFYDRGDYTHAAEEFRRVVDRYPHGNKVPDAMLKLGFSLAAAGDPAGATKALASLVKAFPRHQAAGLASEKLAAPAVETAPVMSSPPVMPAGGPSLKAQATFGPSLSALLPVFPAKSGPESP